MPRDRADRAGRAVPVCYSGPARRGAAGGRQPPVGVGAAHGHDASAAGRGAGRASSEAAAARDAGFRCVKVKVGLPGDADRVAAVRAAAGPEMAIRLDANGAWSVGEAVSTLHSLEPLGVELCEEPTSGSDGIARVSAGTSIPVALDESASEPGAMDRRVCDAAFPPASNAQSQAFS